MVGGEPDAPGAARAASVLRPDWVPRLWEPGVLEDGDCTVTLCDTEAVAPTSIGAV